MLFLLGGVQLPFDNITVNSIKRFVAAAVDACLHEAGLALVPEHGQLWALHKKSHSIAYNFYRVFILESGQPGLVRSRLRLPEISANWADFSPSDKTVQPGLGAGLALFTH